MPGLKPGGLSIVTLRIGQISYANCVPIFSTLRDRYDCADYQFIEGVPAELNRKLLAGEIDLCPSSSILYARHAEELLLLPDLSISSEGPVGSVLLFSRTPLSKLDRAYIALTSESETSAALLRILLKKYLGFSNSFVDVAPPDLLQAFTSCPAVLVIGDTALRWKGDLPHRYRYDLGELWQRYSGLPFVFALWMIRGETVARAPEESFRINAQLLHAKKLARRTLGSLAANSPVRAWIPADSLVDYWRTISYDLTPLHLEGVREFYRDAWEIGLLEKIPVLRFMPNEKWGGYNPPHKTGSQ